MDGCNQPAPACVFLPLAHQGTTSPREEKEMRTITSAAAALSAAALTIGLAGPASADLYGIDDPQDTNHGSDILAMQFRNGADNVHITTYHLGLRKDPKTGSGGSFFIDTDRHDKGPEYVLAGGFFEGTDYVLVETEGFDADKWGDPVENGDYTMRVNYKKERVHVAISRAALGNPGKVRVAVRASGTRTDGTSTGLTDWVGKRREFTPWLKRG